MIEPNWTLFLFCCIAMVVLTVVARILAERWRWVGLVWLCALPVLAVLLAWAVVA